MQRHTVLRIWNYVKKYRLILIIVFLCAFLSNTILIFTPILMAEGIDYMIGKGNVDFKSLLRIIILLMSMYFCSSFFQWIMSTASSIAANRTIYDIRRESFEKLSEFPISYFDKTSHGDIISRLTNDLDNIAEGLFQGITQIMSAFIIIIGSLLFMFSISPLISLAVLATTPLCILIASYIAKHSKRMFAKQSQTVGELNGYVEEIIGNLKVVKAFGNEENVYDEFRKINGRLYGWGQKAQWYSSMTNPTTRFINNIAYVLVGLLGGFMAISGQFSVGKIAGFLTYSNQFAKPINEVTALSSQIQAAFASAERIFSLLDEKPETLVPVSQELFSCQGNVDFEKISFSYRPDISLIKDFSLHVKAGDMIAIVGPTGSGKTTLVNLLMRFYDVNSGHIYIDNHDIYKVTRDSLRSSIGMVLQESWLFAGTIAQNIAYGKEDATREEVIAAAKDAKADSFIRHLPQGYDTMIDEDGGNLSQGQKQLLTIARVMIMNPPMLILDEATSSIDTRTEGIIQKAFSKMMKGKTSFVIAHRLSTIREADRILVIKDGNVIEQGTHRQLMDGKGFYFTLYHSQFNTNT